MARLEDEPDGPAEPAENDPAPAPRRRVAVGSISTSIFVSATGGAFITIYIHCEQTGGLSSLTLTHHEASLLLRNLAAFIGREETGRVIEVAESYAEPDEDLTEPEAWTPGGSGPGGPDGYE